MLKTLRAGPKLAPASGLVLILKRVWYTIDMAWSGMSYRKDCLS
jgi:hypothetical protein